MIHYSYLIVNMTIVSLYIIQLFYSILQRSQMNGMEYMAFDNTSKLIIFPLVKFKTHR